MPTNTEFDIAIIGMACRVPGARNTGEFWANLAAGVESIERLSDNDMRGAGVSASLLAHPAYVKAAPVLDDPSLFDAAYFGYSPGEASAIDPQHRLLLELAHEALEDAGYDPRRGPDRIGVFAGSALNTYFTALGLSDRLTDDYIPTLIGNDKDFLSTRVSYKLNLRGPSVTVQTACSTSLVALHLARQSLLSLETDIALAGATSVRVPHRAGYVCDGGGVVSPDGHVRAFDAKANGTVFGSGGGVVVLKRLDQAIADGDTIRAVIKGSSVNNDGATKAGFTAPSVSSQADAVVEALANAGVNADSISYVEAHGSGTPVGDPIELAALTKAFRTSTQRSAFCSIGSVKSNVGHLDVAAGIAGVIKTVLALEHRQVPPSLHFTEANPEIDFPRTPFVVNTTLRDWSSAGPRRAGVMATGMGGTNAHLILEEAPARTEARAVVPPHLIVLSARTESALDTATTRLREFLRTSDGANMNDVEYTLQAGRRELPHRRFVVCSSRDDAIAAFDVTASRRMQSAHADDATRRFAFLLPGIGDHYVGMAHDVYERSAVFRSEVDRCAALLEPHLGVDIRRVLYPPSGQWKARARKQGTDLRQMLGRPSDAAADPESAELNQTRFAQPALFTIEYAMTRLWQSLGIEPDVVVGHSMGEYVAACIAGVMSLEDALRLLATRARLVSELPVGAMLAVPLPERELVDAMPDALSIALINGPSLCVVAGAPSDVAAFEREMTARGVICRPVQNAHAFHSRMIEPIVREFEAEVKRVQLNPPALPYISNVTGTWITAAEATSVEYWSTHATRTARFSDALSELWKLDDVVLVEAGPGRTLSVLALQHPDRRRDNAPVIASSLRHSYEHQSDVDVLYTAVGRVWLAGATVNWDALGEGVKRSRIPLPTYPFERQRHWIERSNASGPAVRSAVHKQHRVSEWLYAPSWRRSLGRPFVAHERAVLPKDARRWLVFVDEIGLANKVIDRLRRAGHGVVTVRHGPHFEQTNELSFTIDARSADDYARLIGTLHAERALPDRILHAWTVTGPGAADIDADSVANALNLGFHSLLFVVRALAATRVRRDIDLFVLSNDVHEVTGTEAFSPEKATVLGPCTVIRQEYPNIRVRSIDVDVGNRARVSGPVADLVTGELLDPDGSVFVAYRNGQRWIQAYERIDAHGTQARASFRDGGVYLITGGLGNVGIAFAEYLATKYRARLVLVGRSPAPDIGAIQRIEQLGGKVLYLSANAADARAMRAVVAEAHAHFGALNGVIHAVGAVGDDGYREIKDADPEFCERHFEGKVHGLRVLERALEGTRVDFCLLTSSLTAVLGGIGQVAYAAANIYMDAFPRERRRTRGAPWLSVNWDVWRFDTADASSTPLAHRGATLKDLGMTVAEAMPTLETVVALHSAGQVLVSTGDLQARLDQWVNLESLRTGPLSAKVSASHARPSARPALRAPYDAPRDDAERLIASTWQDALGIDAIGINDSFADLGGHSLIAVKIVAELRNAFEIDLPMRALFDAPTVATLADHIKSLLIAEVDSLSDDEARRLVAGVG